MKKTIIAAIATLSIVAGACIYENPHRIHAAMCTGDGFYVYEGIASRDAIVLTAQVTKVKGEKKLEEKISFISTDVAGDYVTHVGGEEFHLKQLAVRHGLTGYILSAKDGSSAAIVTEPASKESAIEFGDAASKGCVNVSEAPNLSNS